MYWDITDNQDGHHYDYDVAKYHILLEESPLDRSIDLSISLSRTLPNDLSTKRTK
jgi:hypothetical protein